MVLTIPARAEALLSALVGVIGDPAGSRIRRGEDVLALADPLVAAGVRFLLPTVILLTAAGVLASVAQSPPRIVPDRILPDASRISVRNGFRRVFGARGWTEFLKSLVKLAAVIAVAMMMLIGQKAVLLTAMETDPGMLPERVLDLAVKTIAAVLVATVAVAAADLAWSRILWRRDHRMSKQELKEELRQAEGDRMIKARLRSLRLDRSRKRMLSAVPRATMVVVNPTHYAVAMRYVRAEGGAPIVVAKGADFIALKIRSIAEDHAIPVIEDKPLARSLYAAVDVDRPIPAEFYRAVAEIVHLIQQRKAHGPNQSVECAECRRALGTGGHARGQPQLRGQSSSRQAVGGHAQHRHRPDERRLSGELPRREDETMIESVSGINSAGASAGVRSPAAAAAPTEGPSFEQALAQVGSAVDTLKTG
jgi:flagellar biosynthetic protein FlhB